MMLGLSFLVTYLEVSIHKTAERHCRFACDSFRVQYLSLDGIWGSLCGETFSGISREAYPNIQNIGKRAWEELC